MVLAGLQSCRQRDLSRRRGHVDRRSLVAAVPAASKSGRRCCAMTGCDRTGATRRHIPVLGAAGLSAILLLGGCSGLRQAVGLDQTAPDEFAVESRAPLTIPPDFDLRPPTPGTRPPREISPAERAQKVIDTAGPGEPGKQATVGLKPADAGMPTASNSADTGQAVADNSLASKLLGAGDSSAGGTVDKRETTTLKSVY